MANEFIIKKGFISKADSVVSGSLTVTEGISGSFSGSFQGDGSGLTGIDPFPFTGDASITGSLTISGSFSSFTLDSDNVVLGAGSGTSMEAGANSNIIVGSNTATSLTTGDFNIILGDSAGAADTNSQKNVLIGQRAGGNATSLSENVFIGNGAGRYGSGLGGNVGIGQDSLKGTANNNGDNNVGIGWQTGFSIEDGAQNVFVGYRSAEAVTTGNYNVIIGKKSGLALTTGGNNIFVGPDAGGAVETGDANIIIGSGSAGAAAMSNQLRIGNGESITVISASLATGEILLNTTTISGSLLNTGTVSIDDTDSPYTITGTQQFILIDPSVGDVTVNMPDASTYPGRQIFFKLTQAAGANTVTLQRQGGDTIDGATTYTDLDIQYESISTVSNGGTGWFIF